MVIVDVFVIAAGFVLRPRPGRWRSTCRFPWLYVCLVFWRSSWGSQTSQRTGIAGRGAAVHRRNLDHYSKPLLDELITIVAAATVMAYSLYTFSAPNLPGSHAMMLTIPFVLYGMFRYLYLVHREGGGGAPEQMLLDDRPFLGTVVFWGITA